MSGQPRITNSGTQTARDETEAMPTNNSLQQASLPPVTANSKVTSTTQVVIQFTQLQPDAPYPGMPPEVLDHFANTYFWKTFRRIGLCLFFFLWLFLFTTSIVLIVIYPRCSKTLEPKWWQRSTFYQVFVPSFQDSDGDGIGDLRGLESRMEEVAFLGVDALVLSPFFQQKGVPMNRFAEDLVTDFDQLDDRLGSKSDLESLVTSARDKGIRLLLELPINHVGSGHPWFNASRNKVANFSNFFLWSEEKPNGWMNRYGSSAWTRDARRNAFFYHSGSAEQPDLNWRSSQLRDVMKKSILKWLDLGLDGVLVTRASDLLEDYDLRDEPDTGSRQYTRDTDDTIDVIKLLRAAIHVKNDSKILMVEVDSPLNTLSRYAAFDKAIVSDLVIPQRSTEILEAPDCDAKCLWKEIKDLHETFPRPTCHANLLSNRRSEKRLTEILKRPSLALLLYGVLPGSLVTYYGDEIGLKGTLTPMRWNNASHGGFTKSSASPWSPTENGQTFDAAKGPHNSSVRIFKTLQAFRKTSPALQHGNSDLVIAEGNVLGIRREADGVPSFLLLVNFGSKNRTSAELGLQKVKGIPSNMNLVIDTLRTSDIHPEERKVRVDALKLEGGQALLLQWQYIVKEYL